MSRLAQSGAWHERARRVIPSCTQTFSKGPSQYVQGVAPAFLSRGQGSHVWDVDGNEYIDFTLALGPMILGYGHPAVIEAVERQLRDGTTFSLPHPLEVELAEALTQIVPSAEMARFCKNGSDATTAAVRVARAATGRDMVLVCGYHGWHDWFIGTTSRNKGVPKAVQALTKPFAYNDLESLRRMFQAHPGQVAAVIMEPTGVVAPQPGFLEGVRDLAHEQGAVLIFDEVLTGFRLALGGAQEYFGVTPDLACFGKAMANGFPLAALVGRRQLMRELDEVFVSSTFGGETLSLAAAVATISTLRREPIIPQLWERGAQLQQHTQALIDEAGLSTTIRCQGLPPRHVMSCESSAGVDGWLVKSLLQQECVKRGVLFSGSHNLSAAHSADDVAFTLEAYRDALATVAQAVRAGTLAQSLEGPPVQPIFRQP